MTPAATAQRRLQQLGLYLGKLDGVPGPLTCDALATFLAGSHAPQLIGHPLAEAIPSDWWRTPARANMMLAQVNAECGFRPLAEDLDYTAERLCKVWPSRFPPADPSAYAGNPAALANLVYSGRDGNCAPTDGWTYRGRGWPQLTGRGNYRAFSDAAGLNLETNPDAMLRLDVSARVTVAFMQREPGLLAAADAGNVAEVRQIWNGGANGLKSAADSFTKLQMLWGLA